MHYEVELGLIMGKTVRDLDPEDTKGAMDAISGTTHISLAFENAKSSTFPIKYTNHISYNHRLRPRH
jgi:hypothetical protein